MISIFIILAILALGILVMIHELGHFLVAKASGVAVLEFTIGFGPAIWKKEKNGTVYALRMVPFGGAVMMEGEDDNVNLSEGSFQSASLPRRTAIICAGSVINLLAGFLILFILFIPVKSYVSPQVSGLMDGFPYAGANGFQVGDTLKTIDGYHIFLYEDAAQQLVKCEGRPVDYEVLRDGRKVVLKDVTLSRQTYVSDGVEGKYFGFKFTAKPAGLLDKIQLSYYNGINFVRIVFESFRMLFAGEAGISDLSGPVAITTTISDMARRSFTQGLYFIAFISVNLGVMNLLPLPALDGGRLLFLLVEAIRGKPVNPKHEGYIHGLGLALFLCLFVFVTFNDIVKLVTNTQ